jgi:hypothetical protein
MGIDIYSGRGIVFTVDEFLKVINGKNKADVVATCIAYSQKLQKEAEQASDHWRTELSESFKTLCSLKKTMKLSEIREVISSIVTVEGEPSKYGNCYVNHSDYVEDLFIYILDDCSEGSNLPLISEVTAWGSGRNNGWDVPKGVACVVFDSDSCFERKLSDQGKAVKKMFGHCDETEWTEMSV